MGLFDILGGSRQQSSGMSPLMLGLMGVLAYRTMSGKGRLADMLGTANNPDAGANSAGGIFGSGGLGGIGGLLSGGMAGGALSSGLNDLLNRFQQNGHGDKAQSWISTGTNQPIAPNELEQALGPERVQWLLQQTGMSKEELMAGLSAKLPEVVDKLTPQGRLPTDQEAARLL